MIANQPKKRILIFSTAYLPYVGGAEVAVKELTDRLAHDFSFVLITARLKPDAPEYEKIGAVEVYRIGKGNAWDKYRLILSGYKKAKELCPLAGGFDLVWGIMASYAGFAALRFKKRNKTVPFLLTLQEGDSKWDIYKHVWWCWPYFKQIFKKANAVQAISSYLSRWALELSFSYTPVIIPNGVAVPTFTPPLGHDQATLRRELRSQLGISENTKIIITVSRLVKKNGLEDLLLASALLPANTHLVILGGGERQPSLERLSAQLGLTKRVHFLGEIAHRNIPPYLWGSDVFCRPSLSEGLGNAFLEAMAAGVPVVATAVGGIPDFLKDGETGLFCQAANAEDIAQKIERVLTDPVLSDKLRANASALVARDYSWGTVAPRMADFIRSLL
ncbi:MAG: glycosyltransferase family 4 protein [Candidatus Magasanikbacteria bacterium]|nr:glycosyltransferase family 4 protein [Candidatus Magasanikbacteria bacterium]